MVSYLSYSVQSTSGSFLLFKFCCHSCDLVVDFDRNYEAHIPTRDDWNESRVDLNDEAVCFTDGSWINSTGQAGASIYNQTDCEEYYYPLGCRCSVFQAEIYAILQCARLHSLHLLQYAQTVRQR